MRWTMAVFWVAIIVAGAGSVAAQQSLSEVAGSIKLKKPEGETVVIDRATLGQSDRPEQSAGSTADALLETSEGCAVAAQVVLDLLGEAGASMAFYEAEWRGRVAEAADELDRAHESLRFTVGRGRYEEAYDTADRGADLTMDGLDALRDSIAANQPVYTEAKRQIAEGIRLLESAQAAIRTVERQEGDEVDPPLIDPIAADRSITSLCGRRFSRETDGYGDCVESQKAAMNALVGRYPPTVGLEVTDFNIVRNQCLHEWPGDFVNRDRCEQRRAAAITK